MDRSLRAGSRRPFTRAAALLGLAGAAFGSAVLALRLVRAAPLEDALGLDGVRTLTGLALLVGGLAFAFAHRAPTMAGQALAGAAALAAAVIGGAGLATSRAPSGEWMAIPTGFALLAIGVGTAWAVRRPHGSRAAQIAGGAAFAASLLVLLGRAYSAKPLYEVGGAMPARAGAALGCALLALALLLARPEYALSRVLAARSLGADLVRRALPALLAVPVAAGLLTLAGLHAGWYEIHVAFAVFTLLAMIALGLLVAASARRIDAIAGERAALEGLFRRTFDNASVGVARLDAEGRWLHVNARLAEIVGWPREELIGRSFAEITHPEDLAFDREVIAALARGELDDQHLEKRYLTKQGHPVWVDLFVSVERAHDGAIDSFVAVVQDIGARKRAERAREEFFALVSHELRSPLHVLGSWLSVLHQESDPERRAHALAIAERSAGLLGRLIGDLLDASRIASGKLEIEPEVFDVQERVEGVVASFQPLAASREVALELALPDRTPFVAGEPERIEQVIRNLLENALKFSDPGGRIRVELAAAAGRVSLSVADTGRGIPPELLPRVFERLTQGEGGPRGARRGLGLGLSIVRHLVELHGGTIEARSDGPGRGATFVVTLPEAEIPRQLAPPASAGESDALDGVHVLVVKPDRIAAEALALALEAADASVVWRRSCEQALAEPWPRQPHALVADLDAVCDDWPEWLRAVRARASRPLVAIAFSAADHTAGRRRAREAGFDAFLGRPVESRRLVSLIHGLLEGPRRVLVVDDEPDAADSLAILLARRGFLVERAYGVAAALAAAARFRPHAVVTDLQLGDEDGAALVRALREREPRPQCVVALTGHTPDAAALEAACFDGVLRKPVDLEQLLALLRSAP